jgi:non-heme chloroperoxidase
MRALAESLRAAGVTTYVPDIRGHGGSGRRGDIDYIGQIEDDLVDFVTQLGPAKSGETRALVGFSAGAGFTIRFAGGPYGLLFDRYVFLSPILPGSPTLRPSAGGWTHISLPRIITIASLDRLGIHWFDGFPVLSYAVSPEMRWVTASYSYRLTMNFGAGRQCSSETPTSRSLRTSSRPSFSALA